MTLASSPPRLTHRMDTKGAIICNGCGRHLRVTVAFLTPGKSAEVVIYVPCKHRDCRLYNMIFLDRLIMC